MAIILGDSRVSDEAIILKNATTVLGEFLQHPYKYIVASFINRAGIVIQNIAQYIIHAR